MSSSFALAGGLLFCGAEGAAGVSTASVPGADARLPGFALAPVFGARLAGAGLAGAGLAVAAVAVGARGNADAAISGTDTATTGTNTVSGSAGGATVSRGAAAPTGAAARSARCWRTAASDNTHVTEAAAAASF